MNGASMSFCVDLCRDVNKAEQQFGNPRDIESITIPDAAYVAKDADPHVVRASCSAFRSVISNRMTSFNGLSFGVMQVYNINIILNDKSSWVVSRRFSQFVALHDYVWARFVRISAGHC
jgi:hypothetical protein